MLKKLKHVSSMDTFPLKEFPSKDNYLVGNYFLLEEKFPFISKFLSNDQFLLGDKIITEGVSIK